MEDELDSAKTIMNDKYDALKARVGTVEARLNELEDLNTHVEGMESKMGKIEILQGRVSGLKGKNKELDVKLEQHAEELHETEARLDSWISDLEVRLTRVEETPKNPAEVQNGSPPAVPISREPTVSRLMRDMSLAEYIETGLAARIVRRQLGDQS